MAQVEGRSVPRKLFSAILVLIFSNLGKEVIQPVIHLLQLLGKSLFMKMATSV